MKRQFLSLMIIFSMVLANNAFAKESTPLSSQDSASLQNEVKGMKDLVSKETVVADAVTAKPAEEVAAPAKKKGYQLPDPDPKMLELKGPLKTTSGMVTGANKMGIAVEYASSKKEGGSEIWFNYTTGIQLNGVKALTDFQMGDSVKVVYAESEDGQKLIKEITLTEKHQEEKEES